MKPMQTDKTKISRTDRTDPVTVDTFIHQGPLKTLLDKARHIALLNDLLIQNLPDALHPYYTVANLRENTLIIHTDTATHATLLRYQLPQLKQAFQKNAMKLTIHDITVAIRPKRLIKK